MRVSLYSRLAWEGIRKNKKLYIPYILTGSVMVMMYYILSYLIESPTIMLTLGCIVIAVFSLLFLFYTNSFLIRQRYREFGLYNILGMDKKNISKLMVWESIFCWCLCHCNRAFCGDCIIKDCRIDYFKYPSHGCQL